MLLNWYYSHLGRQPATIVQRLPSLSLEATVQYMPHRHYRIILYWRHCEQTVDGQSPPGHNSPFVYNSCHVQTSQTDWGGVWPGGGSARGVFGLWGIMGEILSYTLTSVLELGVFDWGRGQNREWVMGHWLLTHNNFCITSYNSLFKFTFHIVYICILLFCISLP